MSNIFYDKVWGTGQPIIWQQYLTCLELVLLEICALLSPFSKRLAGIVFFPYSVKRFLHQRMQCKRCVVGFSSSVRIRWYNIDVVVRVAIRHIKVFAPNVFPFFFFLWCWSLLDSERSECLTEKEFPQRPKRLLFLRVQTQDEGWETRLNQSHSR